jgi:exopolysaccharide biosynthesis WecB/TagA/CpsF family protein
MGIIYGSRIRGRPIRESVTGRLLPEAVVRHPGGKNLRIALFGGPPGTAELAGERLATAGATVVDAFGPSMRFVLGSKEDEEAVARLNRSGAQLVWVGLGAPKQELWMARSREQLPGAVLVGVGQALDVLSGRVRAAPSWMTHWGVEWAFRLLMRPERFARRYLWDDPRFFAWMIAGRLRPRARPE